MSFASGLKKARRKKGLTQAQLGEMIGVANTTISGYEKGTSEASEDKIRAIMDVLSVDANALFEWEGDSRIDEVITSQGVRIGLAYDRAAAPIKRTVEVALEPYMEASEELAPDLSKYEEPEMIEMKVYDEPAAAGLGDYLSGDSYEVMSFPVSEVPGRADFGVRISGNSMEPTIDNGSIAWVQAMPEVRNGDIGIFILNNNAYCKELYIDAEERRVYLVSHNDDYDDIPINEEDDLRTVGKVLL